MASLNTAAPTTTIAPANTMTSSPTAPEVTSPSKPPPTSPLSVQIPQTSNPASPEAVQSSASSSLGSIGETQRNIGTQASLDPHVEAATSSSSPKITSQQSNVAAPIVRGRPRARTSSLRSMEPLTRRSSTSSRSSVRTNHSADSHRHANRRFNPLSTIKSEKSFHASRSRSPRLVEDLTDHDDIEDVSRSSIQTLRDYHPEIESSNHLIPSTNVVRSVSPPSQIELDNHDRVFNELDVKSMPPRKRSYTRARYMTPERKLWLAFLAITFPPLAVKIAIGGKCWRQVVLATILWILGVIPGIVYAVTVIMAPWRYIPESRDKKWLKRKDEKDYELARLRSEDTDAIDEDANPKPRRRGWLLRRKQHPGPPPTRWAMSSVG